MRLHIGGGGGGTESWPAETEELNLHGQRAGLMLYQMSYILAYAFIVSKKKESKIGVTEYISVNFLPAPFLSERDGGYFSSVALLL